MSENSKIEWCHHTFNPWIGCTKVGPGCDAYMQRIGKKAAGRLLDGVLHDGYPEVKP